MSIGKIYTVRPTHSSSLDVQGLTLPTPKGGGFSGVGFGMKRARVFTKSLDIVGVLRVIV